MKFFSSRRFTQKQDPDLIHPVLDHNRLDLPAMARLFKPVERDGLDGLASL